MTSVIARLSCWLWLALMIAAAPVSASLPCGEFKVYQFPANAIPRIDGNPQDWAEVPADFAIGTDKLAADDGTARHPDARSLAVSVKVGWVAGLNRIYVLYDAYDDFWELEDSGLKNDIFELVIDGDRSGGPLISRFHPDLASEGNTGGLSAQDAWFSFQNVHAQNYHIFTPAHGKDWAMAWGPQAGWIKRLPWSNIAYRENVRQGQPGHLTMEFWITPFDHASSDGPEHSVETKLTENAIIAMAWAVIDRDGPQAPAGQFWNLSPQHTMYGQASQLCAFKLMTLAANPAQPIKADWSFAITDRANRLVSFHDESRGEVAAWHWDFGDGTTSSEQHPQHRYTQPGKFVVILDVTGPHGAARLSKVWDVSFVGDPPK